MPNQFMLEITTPERRFVMEMVDMVILPADDGDYGVMAGHEKIIMPVVNGVIRIQTGAEWREAACGEGYVMVYGDEVIVLVQSVEWPSEIDYARAEAALRRAEARMLTEESQRDRALTHMALKRANTRLTLLRGRRQSDDKK